MILTRWIMFDADRECMLQSMTVYYSLCRHRRHRHLSLVCCFHCLHQIQYYYYYHYYHHCCCYCCIVIVIVIINNIIVIVLLAGWFFWICASRLRGRLKHAYLLIFVIFVKASKQLRKEETDRLRLKPDRFGPQTQRSRATIAECDSSACRSAIRKAFRSASAASHRIKF